MVSSKTTKKADTRYRNWATIVYPDSAPENWLEVISELKIQCFVSPLHDADVNPTGECKKSHYHVLLLYEGKKSFEQISDVVSTFGGVTPQAVQSARGYARYLCHLDNPEKHQYNQEDVKSFGGADYTHLIGLQTDRYKGIREMISWCNENGIVMFSDLIEYAMESRPDWFRLLCDSCTVVMKEYLKSKEYSLRK